MTLCYPQANPLNHKQPDIHLMTGSRGMLAAKQPLAVPMLLRLSHFRLSSYVVLVVSKQKGITLVFKTDPLQNVDINSTFDSIAVIQKFIQREIEGQLRQMFREDLPGIIHRLSQQWIKAKVEAPYLNKRFPPAPTESQSFETMSSPDLITRPSNAGPSPHSGRALSLETPSSRRPRSVSGDSTTSFNRRTSSRKTATTSTHVPPPDSHCYNEYENFDPTYGLRPESLPTKSGFKAFSSLFTPSKGLANLTEEPSDGEDEEDYVDDGESTSFDVVEWEDTAPGISPPASVYTEHISTPEYETIPAVGGGTIIRPRILHSQSSIQPPAGITPRLSLNPYSRSQSSIRSGITPNILTRHHSSGSHFSGIQSLNNPHFPSRPRTPDSVDSSISDGINDHHSQHHHKRQLNSVSPTRHLHDPAHTRYLNSNPNHIPQPNSQRRLSISSAVSHQTVMTSASNNNPVESIMTTFSTSPGKSSSIHSSPYPNMGSESNSKIIRPSLNADSIHHLSTLSHLNHTLSPYTHSLSHFTVRSVPPRSWSLARGGLNTGERQQPIKAKRKRIFWIHGKKPTDSTTSVPTEAGAVSPRISTVNTEINQNFAFGQLINGHVQPTAGEFAFGSGHDPGESGSTDRAHYLRQHQFVPSEFDAEDMDRYFRSNDDPPVVLPPPLSVSGDVQRPSNKLSDAPDSIKGKGLLS